MCVVSPNGESEVRSGVASELRSAIVLGGVDFYEDISGTLLVTSTSDITCRQVGKGLSPGTKSFDSRRCAAATVGKRRVLVARGRTQITRPGRESRMARFAAANRPVYGARGGAGRCITRRRFSGCGFRGDGRFQSGYGSGVPHLRRTAMEAPVPSR